MLRSFSLSTRTAALIRSYNAKPVFSGNYWRPYARAHARSIKSPVSVFDGLLSCIPVLPLGDLDTPSSLNA